MNFKAGRGATYVRVFFKQKDIKSRLGQKCCVGQAVMTCADDDGIIFLQAGWLPVCQCQADDSVAVVLWHRFAYLTFFVYLK